MPAVYPHYFTLSEALAVLPQVRNTIEQAHVDLAQKQDALILLQRMIELETEDGQRTTPEALAREELLHEKWLAFEEDLADWVEQVTEQGVLVKDFARGLVDFPYRASDGTEYLLCWQLGEDGLLYFHQEADGFAGRKPITLLPD